jgi:hypothetical protein
MAEIVNNPYIRIKNQAFLIESLLIRKAKNERSILTNPARIQIISVTAFLSAGKKNRSKKCIIITIRNNRRTGRLTLKYFKKRVEWTS